MMRIEDSKGVEIRTLEEWAKLYDTPQKSRQWKEHRSAYSVAEFMLNHDGSAHLQKRVSGAIGEAVRLERAVPEYELRFDEFGQGRVHDLGIFGTTAVGQSVFVGLEAKVDEPFGASVLDTYLEAKARQIVGESTKAPERIEKLLELHFTTSDVSMFDLRYQLLYATAGTLAANADISILYIVVFKTPLFDEVIGANNYRDYIHFVNKVGGQPVKLDDKGAIAHRMVLGRKNLICLHEYFNL
jgi:hypothetical protein